MSEIWNYLTSINWGAFATAISAAIAIATWWNGRRLRAIEGRLKQTELRDKNERSELALDIDLAPSVFKIADGWVLELRVRMRNISSRRWAFPAIYASGRPLDGPGVPSTLTDADFSRLPECDGLSVPRNVVLFPHTLIQVTPSETEVFVRIDRLPDEFVRQHPLVLLSVDVYGASDELIGERYNRHTRTTEKGEFRDRWIRYMAGASNRRQNHVVFAKWPLGSGNEPPHEGGLQPGQRYLIREDGEPDLENTRTFQPVLDSVWIWSRCVTVAFPTPSGTPNLDPPGAPSDGHPTP